jgi:hypothetical protein
MTVSASSAWRRVNGVGEDMTGPTNPPTRGARAALIVAAVVVRASLRQVDRQATLSFCRSRHEPGAHGGGAG